MIDAHCHLQFADFDEVDPFACEDSIEDDQLAISGYIVADFDSQRRQQLSELANRPDTWISAGIHPWAISHDFHHFESEWAKLNDFVDEHHKRLIAIGEFGLDRMMRRGANFEVQTNVFRLHLELALKFDLPVVLHIVGAEESLIEFLKEDRYKDVRPLCHGFSGTPEQARRLTNLGALISIGTDVLRGRGRTFEVCKQLGMGAFAIETDSPDRCPPELESPMRPHYLRYVARAIAAQLRVEPELVAASTEAATRLFFNL